MVLNFVERCKEMQKVINSFFNPDLVVTYDGHRPTKCFTPVKKERESTWVKTVGCGWAGKVMQNVLKIHKRD